MKRLARQIVILSLALLGNLCFINAQMVNMVKGMINQFGNMQASDFETDEIITEAAPFPVEEKVDKQLYTRVLQESEKLFKLTDPQNGYTEIDGKEYATNSITLEFSYIPLPCFQCVNAWYENISIQDKDGNNLLMKEKEVEKYRELGIIDDDFNFPMPGSVSETYWLNRELQWEEKIIISGRIMLEYPQDYELAIMTSTDTEESYTIGGITYKLIDIDRNIATLLIKGDRRKMEGVKTILLNKDNMPFGSTSSVSIDADLYDIENGAVKEMTDEEIQASIENFNMADTHVEQVKKTKVNGNIDKLALIKVNEHQMLEQDFKVELASEF